MAEGMWTIGGFINLVLMVVIFASLIGTIATSITGAQGNVSGEKQ